MILYYIPKSMTRELKVITQRLTLGYKCTRENVESMVRACSYCKFMTEESLLHYLLECRNIIKLRRVTRKPLHDANLPDAKQKATEMVHSLLENIEAANILLECPPSR